MFLSDLIQEKVFEKLPYISPRVWTLWQKLYSEMAADIVNGNASRSDCVSSRDRVKIIINGKELSLVPFVEDIVESGVKGLLSPLKGYEEGMFPLLYRRNKECFRDTLGSCLYSAP